MGSRSQGKRCGDVVIPRVAVEPGCRHVGLQAPRAELCLCLLQDLGVILLWSPGATVVALPSAGGREAFPSNGAWGALPKAQLRCGLLRSVQHQPSSSKEPNDVNWMALALCAKMTFIYHPILMALERLGKELLFLLVQLQQCQNARRLVRHCVVPEGQEQWEHP